MAGAGINLMSIMEPADVFSPEVLKAKLAGSESSIQRYEQEKFIDSIYITNINCLNLVFDRCIFNKVVAIKDVANSKLRIEFIRCIFVEGLVVNHCEFNNLQVLNCQFDKFLTLEHFVTGSLCLNGGQLHEVFINDLKTKVFTVDRTSNTRVNAGRIVAQQLSIKNNSGDFTLTINGASGFHFGEGSSVDEMTIFLSSEQIGKILMKSLMIKDLSVTGYLSDPSQLEFEHIVFGHISFRHFINSGRVKFAATSFQLHSSITAIQTDFANTVIFGVDFNSVETFYVDTINLKDIIYAGVKWCDSIRSSGESKMSFVQLKDVYKQLKNLTAASNDKPEELKFYGLEMDAYNRAIKGVRLKRNDRLILRFNRYSNNHGQSWIAPLGMIVIAIVAAYFPIKYFLGFTVWRPKNWPIALSEMAECINPFRKFTDSFGMNSLPKNNIYTAIAKLIDIIVLRLIVGLLIFQMVKAFRKYVK